MVFQFVSIAQLAERKTEDLEALCSNNSRDIYLMQNTYLSLSFYILLPLTTNYQISEEQASTLFSSHKKTEKRAQQPPSSYWYAKTQNTPILFTTIPPPSYYQLIFIVIPWYIPTCLVEINNFFNNTPSSLPYHTWDILTLYHEK